MVKGEMPERANGAVSKTVVRLCGPRVRIPVSPPQKRRSALRFFIFMVLRVRTEPTKEVSSRAYASNPCLSATETKEYPSFFYSSFLVLEFNLLKKILEQKHLFFLSPNYPNKHSCISAT